MTTGMRSALERVVHENGPVVIDWCGEKLAWRPLDYGTWTALEASPDTGGWQDISTAGLRPEVLAFAHLMERQLQANDHKPGWKDDEPDALYQRLWEEARELDYAVDRWNAHIGMTEVTCRTLVGREAADVANFAMMIADVCNALPAAPTPKGSEA